MLKLLKCEVCGGEISVDTEFSTGKCKYCEAQFVIPKGLERKENLFNRAVFLRQNKEFDKAMSTYEDILKEDNADAGAHWGLVLSKYGIEYVADPRTNEYIPTCNRAQMRPIISDPDYLAAVGFADPQARQAIEKEAKRINEIHSKIIEISKREAPYDVFICYKESDELGHRTEDSFVAQELYNELVKKNYKVFYARKTLEKRLGSEYEPIIYAALSSAKVMIVLGLKPEHFNAAWVRNEWSRFYEMARSSNKTIIPAYRGMSPYELPVELSALQSQDMSKLGFLPELIDGIERIIGSSIVKEPPLSRPAPRMDADKLFENGLTYIRLGDFETAKGYYETATKDSPEDYRGWWGLIVCSTKSFTNIVLDQTQLNHWLKYVKELAPSKNYEECLKTYTDYTFSVASISAIDEMQTARSKIASYAEKIRSVEADIQKMKDECVRNEQLFQQNLKHNQESLEQHRKESAVADRNYLLRCFAHVLGIGMLIVGFVFTILGLSNGLGDELLIGLPMGGIGFLIWVKRFTSNDFHDKYSAHKKVFQAQEYASTLEENHRNEVENTNQKISQRHKEIESMRSQIAICQAYLDVGEENITESWFAEKCKAFGVEKKSDIQTDKKRKEMAQVRP